MQSTEIKFFFPLVLCWLLLINRIYLLTIYQGFFFFFWKTVKHNNILIGSFNLLLETGHKAIVTNPED